MWTKFDFSFSDVRLTWCLSIPLLPVCDLSWPNSIKSDIHVVVLLVARKQAAGCRKKVSVIVLSPILPLLPSFWERNVKSKSTLEGESLGAGKRGCTFLDIRGSVHSAQPKGNQFCTSQACFSHVQRFSCASRFFSEIQNLDAQFWGICHKVFWT